MWWFCKRPLRGTPTSGSDAGQTGPPITLCPRGAPSSHPVGCLGKVTPCATRTTLPGGDRNFPRRAPEGPAWVLTSQGWTILVQEYLFSGSNQMFTIVSKRFLH